MSFDIRKIIKSRWVRSRIMYGLSFLPDAVYISLFYFATTGRWPNLRSPRGYNEKLQWLKLHDIHPEYRDYADKLKVRKIIEEKIGAQYLIPLLGCWDSFDAIDFESLPDQFVLKCNHDSGSVKLIRNKKNLTEADYGMLKDYYDRRMSHDFFLAGREYPYKGIKPMILAEKFMKNESEPDKGINDYKFFCFDGRPRLLLCVTGRQKEKHEDYFDMDFHRLLIYNGFTESKTQPEKPVCFVEMQELAAKLTEGMKQVRLDLYEIHGKVYFGEYTFFSGGGFELFHPDEWEQRLGSWIHL